jgi:hypothetical protein
MKSNTHPHHGTPTQQDLTVTVPTREHGGISLSIPLNRTVIDANLLSWVGGGLSEALLAAREGIRAAEKLKALQRKRLEDLVEEAVSVLDMLDGDPDLEEDAEGDEGEDDAPGLIQGGSERLAY